MLYTILIKLNISNQMFDYYSWMFSMRFLLIIFT